MWDLPHSFACAGFRVVGTSYMAMRFQLLFFVFRIGSNRPCAIMPMALALLVLRLRVILSRILTAEKKVWK